jgi:hypothetical protein
MFTLDHMADMADFFVGLKNFLDRAPEHHLAALAMVLSEYQSQLCSEYGPGDPSFGAILLEVGGICAVAAETAEVTLEPYRGALRDDGRRVLAAEAVSYATAEHATPQGLAKVYQTLIDFHKPTESKPPAKKGPQTVKPKRKRKAAA